MFIGSNTHFISQNVAFTYQLCLNCMAKGPCHRDAGCAGATNCNQHLQFGLVNYFCFFDSIFLSKLLTFRVDQFGKVDCTAGNRLTCFSFNANDFDVLFTVFNCFFNRRKCFRRSNDHFCFARLQLILNFIYSRKTIVSIKYCHLSLHQLMNILIEFSLSIEFSSRKI